MCKIIAIANQKSGVCKIHNKQFEKVFSVFEPRVGMLHHYFLDTIRKTYKAPDYSQVFTYGIIKHYGVAGLERGYQDSDYGGTNGISFFSYRKKDKKLD